jgi:hypothetical protein
MIQDLRLLARARVRTTRDGRVLSGFVHPVYEGIRQAALDAFDALQDGLRLAPEQQEALSMVHDCVDYHRATIRTLRRDLEREAT